jgi:hypothetical protein
MNRGKQRGLLHEIGSGQCQGGRWQDDDRREPGRRLRAERPHGAGGRPGSAGVGDDLVRRDPRGGQALGRRGAPRAGRSVRGDPGDPGRRDRPAARISGAGRSGPGSRPQGRAGQDPQASALPHPPPLRRHRPGLPARIVDPDRQRPGRRGRLYRPGSAASSGHGGAGGLLRGALQPEGPDREAPRAAGHPADPGGPPHAGDRRGGGGDPGGLGEAGLPDEIPINVRLAEAPAHGRTIFEHESWSTGALAYGKLGGEVLRRGRKADLL